mgnify:CR=1 FL=1
MTKSQTRRLKLNCLKALRSDTCEDCGKSDRFDILEFHHIVPRHISGRPKIRHTELDAEHRDDNMNYNYRHMTLEDMLSELED